MHIDRPYKLDITAVYKIFIGVVEAGHSVNQTGGLKRV